MGNPYFAVVLNFIVPSALIQTDSLRFNARQAQKLFFFAISEVYLVVSSELSILAGISSLWYAVGMSFKINSFSTGSSKLASPDNPPVKLFVPPEVLLQEHQ